MQAVPYLYFNGDAEEAVSFYVEALKADPPQIMRYKQQPYPDMPAENAEKILHAEMIVSGCSFYLSDTVGSDAVQVGNNLQINLNCDSEEQLHWIYAHLKRGRENQNGAAGHFLGFCFRHADRPVWHLMEFKLYETEACGRLIRRISPGFGNLGKYESAVGGE